MRKIDKLTPEQEAMLPGFRDFSLHVALSTERTNRSAAEVAIKAHYLACGLAAPEVRWFDSPFASVEASVGDTVKDSVGGSVLDSVDDSAADSVEDSVEDSVRDRVLYGDGVSVRDIRNNVRNGVRGSVQDIGNSVNNSIGAHYDSHYAALIMAWHAYGVSLDPRALTYVAITEHLWWWYPGKDIVFASDRPTAINLDENGRLHCENGMAIRFADETGVSAWHGTTVPHIWLADRENLDPNEVIRAQNVEQRAAGAAIVGWPRMLSVLQCRVIEDSGNDDIGQLIELSLPGLPEPGRFLKAVCPRNGIIVEGVPRVSDIDGLPIDTALSAQAWRVGDPQSDYLHPARRT